jgi:23S rRNA (adenine2030-N6)-methyltransferase
MLIGALLRGSDRLACCELHPEDGTALKRLFHQRPQIEVHARSGWEALGALLPPKEKRGMVFIDPPFEQPDEFRTLIDGLRRAHRRFSSGVFAAWYPVKRMAAIRQFHADIAALGIADIITIELRLRDAVDPDRLNGCGFAVINPPYQFEVRGLEIATGVLQGLGAAETGAGVTVTRLADE